MQICVHFFWGFASTICLIRSGFVTWFLKVGSSSKSAVYASGKLFFNQVDFPVPLGPKIKKAVFRNAEESFRICFHVSVPASQGIFRKKPNPDKPVPKRNHHEEHEGHEGHEDIKCSCWGSKAKRARAESWACPCIKPAWATPCPSYTIHLNLLMEDLFYKRE